MAGRGLLADIETLHLDRGYDSAATIERCQRLGLTDEWQRLPAVWDHVRRKVDDGAAPGRYLLTGSAAPAGAPVHSGAGRIVSVRMRPLTLAERQISTPTVSLTAMLSGDQPHIQGNSKLTLTDYVREILASGFPGIRPLAVKGQRAQLAGYLARVVERDFPDQGLRIPVPGWTPSRSHVSRLGSAPKHHLADPALAASLLGVDAGALLKGENARPAVPRDGTLLGALFESLVTLSTRVYAQAAGAETRHLRTQNGDHEVDLILERPDHKVVALEVQLAPTVDDHDVTHLLWLRERLGEDLLDTAVITTGTRAYRRKDGIAVIPAALLGP